MSDDKLIVIDGNEVPFKEGETVLEAAAKVGIDIPTLCYDPRLDSAGACRMCLVEVEGSRLMQPACSYRAAKDLVVRTQTPKVERNRQFILSLHLADTIHDREVMEDANPSKIHALADEYGTAGEWLSVDKVAQRAGPRRQSLRPVPGRPLHCLSAFARGTATRSRRSRRSRSLSAVLTPRSRPPTSGR